MSGSSAIITADTIQQVLLASNRQYLYVSSTGLLRNGGETVSTSAFFNRITNNGEILQISQTPEAGQDFPGALTAVRLSGHLGTLVNNGMIAGMDFSAVSVALTLSNHTNAIVNAGAIDGRVYGVQAQSGTVTISNSGSITGGAAGVQGGAAYVSVDNTGTITGDTGVNLAGTSGGGFVGNAGTISGRFGAVVGSNYGDIVINAGLLQGAVSLQNGNDLYDGTRGRITGGVFGGGGADTLLGGAGPQSLNGEDDNDSIEGGDGRDLLVGGDGADTLVGGLGNDTLRGDGGADQLDGGDGFDLVSYFDSFAVRVDLNDASLNTGDAEDDELIGFEGVIGGFFSDTLSGTATANRLDGGTGDDVLDGKAGRDTMLGGFGNDLFTVDNAGDSVVERAGFGADTVRSSVSWTLAADSEIEVLQTTSDAGTGAINLTGSSAANWIRGNAGANRLNGRGGADTLSGLGGSDSLSGGAGDDSLAGGGGNDSLLGGIGADTLQGGAGGDSLVGEAGTDTFVFDSLAAPVDVIRDFVTVDDTILLAASAFGALSTGKLDAGLFLASSTSVFTANSQRVLYNTTTGDLLYDTDGDGAAASVTFGRIVNLTGTLESADFLIA